MYVKTESQNFVPLSFSFYYIPRLNLLIPQSLYRWCFCPIGRTLRSRRHEASLRTHLISYLSKPTMSFSFARLRFVSLPLFTCQSFFLFLLILSPSPSSFTLLMMVLLYLTAPSICILPHSLSNLNRF